MDRMRYWTTLIDIESEWVFLDIAIHPQVQRLSEHFSGSAPGQNAKRQDGGLLVSHNTI